MTKNDFIERCALKRAALSLRLSGAIAADVGMVRAVEITESFISAVILAVILSDYDVDVEALARKVVAAREPHPDIAGKVADALVRAWEARPPVGQKEEVSHG
jgi:hypothetical protein